MTISSANAIIWIEQELMPLYELNKTLLVPISIKPYTWENAGHDKYHQMASLSHHELEGNKCFNNFLKLWKL